MDRNAVRSAIDRRAAGRKPKLALPELELPELEHMGVKPKPKGIRSQVQQLAEARKRAAERHSEQGSKNILPEETEVEDGKRLMASKPQGEKVLGPERSGKVLKPFWNCWLL